MARYFTLRAHPRENQGAFVAWRLTKKDGSALAFLTTHDLRRIARRIMPMRDILVERGTRHAMLKLTRQPDAKEREAFLAALDEWYDRAGEYNL